MCTFFKYQTNNGVFIGKNYDVPSPCYGAVFFNPAGIQKRALIKPPDVPVTWESEYASFSFNQVARDYPASGMNEKGLVVEQTTLWNTIYPDKDDRKAITELQLIQYLLDTCCTVEQALVGLNQVRISQHNATLQYIIADSDDNICLIEFIMGEMLVFKNEDFVYNTITNDMLQTSVDYLQTHKGYGGNKEHTPGHYSLDRYISTVKEIKCLKTAPLPYSGFDMLDKSKFNDTQWQIIYEPDKLILHWRTHKNTSLKKVNLYDFRNCNLCLMSDIEKGGFLPYSYKQNHQLACKFFYESVYFKNLKINPVLVETIAGINHIVEH